MKLNNSKDFHLFGTEPPDKAKTVMCLLNKRNTLDVLLCCGPRT